MSANFDELIGRTIIVGQSPNVTRATILGWCYDRDTKGYRVFFMHERMIRHACVWEIVFVEEEPVIIQIRPLTDDPDHHYGPGAFDVLSPNVRKVRPLAGEPPPPIETCCRLEMEAKTPRTSATPTIVIACGCGRRWRWTPTPEGGIQIGRWDKVSASGPWNEPTSEPAKIEEAPFETCPVCKWQVARGIHTGEACPNCGVGPNG